MEGEVIKSFLVGLGFGVDTASLANFNKSIASATLKVTALYASVKVAATGIAYGISKVSEDFEKMGYEYHIIAPAINKALLLRRELLKAYSAAGINISKVVRESLKLNLSLTKTRFAFEAIYKSVASRFFEVLTKQSDLFRQRIYANMPKIQKILESLIKFIFKAFEATTELGLRLWSILSRVYDFFVALDKATDGWSTKVLGVIAVWKLLNLEFLASPLGILLALGVAVLALYDDFKTFQEGGKSLIDWKKYIPTINAVEIALKAVNVVLHDIGDTIANVIVAFERLFHKDFTGAAKSFKDALSGVLEVSPLYQLFKVLTNSLGKNGGIDLNNAGTNIQNTGPKGIPTISPLGSQGINNSSQTNQHVSQQTNINLNGTPDILSTARAISGEQGRVNFDLVRNLKGSIKPGGFVGAK